MDEEFADLNKAQATISGITELGYELSPSSRFASHSSTLDKLSEALNRSIPPSDQLVCEAGIAISEVRELASILRHLGRAQPWREHIQRIFSGHESPYKDANVQARSSQFEMYIASRASAAGLHPILAEPDLVVDHKKWKVGIAAKRLNSEQKIRDRIKDASEQISNTRYPGLIFLDFTKILFKKEHALRVRDPNLLRELILLVYHQAIHPRVIDSMDTVLRDNNGSTLGALIFFNAVGFDKFRNCPVDVMMRFSVLSTKSSPTVNERVAQLMRVFHAEDGSLSHTEVNPELHEKWTQRIRRPFELI